ncbi:MAG: type I glutamate--ammonia ligase [Nitrospirae bacterium]|nr:MAG: type I glutamate--ammonia ligase [Nitrospirae bacterium 13_2_20CM_62_7]OLC80733.1 MAG: type I glutamate--ammonia ligase [Nitrospirae bacterium 13_1_40CM_3_62_11]OLD40580.1 MAG: type I glutamate--ammonia ligase [Nitrospirae bacterium 13_1_40CM_2_62_10]OLE42402.1 MAG: type I glutamate--ammonia ligase [Nitrospirae bacterium 13_1_20CM_2_62_14]TLY44606.1 MAG: type I glutamate--ammonia ligase [Nitrospirota bacterium]
MSPREVLEYAKKNKAQVVDLKFVDLLGTWQHFSIPIEELNEGTFKDGSGFDGSSIRGWKAIHSSDMLVIPDPATACMDPFMAAPTLSLICDVVDPITREGYERDPRNIAQKAEQYLKSTRIGDISYWGPEAEFFIFDQARYDQNSHSGYYFIDSEEGIWNSGKEGANLGSKPRHKEGYFPVAPTDTLQDIRSEMILEMQKAGMQVEKQHHEVATAGQAEIDLRFDSLVAMADKMMMYKYIVKNVARRHNKCVTFMPKPLFGDNGSGMHTHQSIWKEGKPLFAGKEYAGVSQLCLFYIGGIMKHAPALAALMNPTTNSYKRLTPGFEAPVLLAYSSRNRSAGIRIPMYSPSPKAKRIEVRFPDPACNPYLAFAAMLMAGLDGIENKLDPGEPMDKDLYDLEPREAARIPTMPGSLDDAMKHLEKDHQFLLKGGVFSEDLIETWIAYKRGREVDALRLRPHPYEFFMYFDV